MLLFGLHCHQPVENFGWVVDKAIDSCYRPLIKTLNRYPNFKFSIHFSGWLLEYIRKHASDIFNTLKLMSKRGQIEFFSGGFYEPILESIPEDDRISQIKRMNNYIKKHFRQIPKGLWLTERVYSDEIIKDIAKCGLEYITIDNVFIDNISYTQSGDYTVKLLPIDKTLRYSIPFKEVNSVEILLKSKKINIIFDDCEKFGVWPGTKEWVYKRGWLEKFLSKDFETVLPKEILKEIIPKKVALPEHSYQEMELWSLDTDDYFKYKKLEEKLKGEEESLIERFMRGSVWKNFLNKYFEANWIQKRVWQLSKRKNSKRKYLESLFKAQCNDVLWHGIFGGLYLPNLRDNAYRYIVKCENMLPDDIMEKNDIDGDLRLEYKYKNKNFIAIFNSFGELIEFDDRLNLFNFQNTIRRYKERYHFSKEEKKGFDTIHNLSHDFSKYPLKFDKYFKFSFITDKENFKITQTKNKLTFNGKGIKKSFRFSENKIDFSFNGVKTVEMNLHFANNCNIEPKAKGMKIEDEYTKRTIEIKFNQNCEFEIEDIVTYTLKESGVDQIKQGISIRYKFEVSDIKGTLCLK